MGDVMPLGKIVYVREDMTNPHGQMIIVIKRGTAGQLTPFSGIIGGSFELQLQHGGARQVGLTARHIFEYNEKRWRHLEQTSLHKELSSTSPVGGNLSKSLRRLRITELYVFSDNLS
jgi:hypothetical protein